MLSIFLANSTGLVWAEADIDMYEAFPLAGHRQVAGEMQEQNPLSPSSLLCH